MVLAKHRFFVFFVFTDKTAICHSVRKKNPLGLRTNTAKTSINTKSNHSNRAHPKQENSHHQLKIIEPHSSWKIIHIKNSMIDLPSALLFINNYEDRYPACCVVLASDGSIGECSHEDGVLRRAWRRAGRRLHWDRRYRLGRIAKPCLSYFISRQDC